MYENVLVSIISPVYKIPRHLLEKSISCMMAQTHTKIEILLVDDGSPDDCGEVCDYYAKIDRRIKVFHTPNGGVSHARNLGINNSCGEYICFVDSDDYLAPNAVELLLIEAINENTELVVSNYSVSEKEKNTTQKRYVFYGEDIYKIKKSFISGGNILNLDFTGAPWGKLYRASTIKINDCFFDESLPRSQDNEFNFRFADFVNKCVFIDCCLYVYNVYGNSAMRKYWKNAEKNADILLEKIERDICCLHNSEYYKTAYNEFVITKILDILQTDITHPSNECTRKERIDRIKSLSERDPYRIAIHNNTSNSFYTYRGIIINLMKFQKYHLVLLIADMKTIAKRFIK